MCVCHPPCGQWGNFKFRARYSPLEKSYATLSVSLVRKWGGVVEHPASSNLWKEVMDIPKPGEPADIYGGYSIKVNQCWFGHPAVKATVLYIVGCEKKLLPTMSYENKVVREVIKLPKGGWERDHTPRLLAEWLIKVCTIINKNKYDKGKKTNMVK